MKMFLVYDGQHKQRINADSAAVAAEIFASCCFDHDGDACHEVVVTTQGDVGEGDGDVFDIEWTPKAVRR